MDDNWRDVLTVGITVAGTLSGILLGDLLGRRRAEATRFDDQRREVYARYLAMISDISLRFGDALLTGHLEEWLAAEHTNMAPTYMEIQLIGGPKVRDASRALMSELEVLLRVTSKDSFKEADDKLNEKIRQLSEVARAELRTS